jgi:hypothetical protein
MWNQNQPANLNNLCKVALLTAQLGRLVMQRRLAGIDAHLKANNVMSPGLAKEYALYSVKADKETAITLGIKTPPVVEHIDIKSDF